MAVKFKDYYETLGVPRTATAAEIKKAYRKLALVHHPDVAKDKVAGEEKFREINEAYQVLSDPEKRKRFDELGANWEDPGFGGAPGAGARQSYGQPGGEEGGAQEATAARLDVGDVLRAEESHGGPPQAAGGIHRVQSRKAMNISQA